MALSSGMGDFSGCKGDLTRKRKTTQYKPAELNRPRQNRAASMHRDTARDKLVIQSKEADSSISWGKRVAGVQSTN